MKHFAADECIFAMINKTCFLVKKKSIHMKKHAKLKNFKKMHKHSSKFQSETTMLKYNIEVPKRAGKHK